MARRVANRASELSTSFIILRREHKRSRAGRVSPEYPPGVDVPLFVAARRPLPAVNVWAGGARGIGGRRLEQLDYAYDWSQPIRGRGKLVVRRHEPSRRRPDRPYRRHLAWRPRCRGRWRRPWAAARAAEARARRAASRASSEGCAWAGGGDLGAARCDGGVVHSSTIFCLSGLSMSGSFGCRASSRRQRIIRHEHRRDGRD